MRLFLVVVLVSCVLLVSAAPGKKDKKGKKPPRGHGKPDNGPGGRDRGPGGRPEHGQGRPGGRPDHNPGGRPDRGPGGRPEPGRGRPDLGQGGGRPDRGQGGGRPDRGQGGRPETPSGWRDPRCRNLECSPATRDSYICATDGETYESACHLLQLQCGGNVPAEVEVYFEGRCQHPAEAGEPHGHHGPGHRTPHGHHGPGHHTPHGHHGKRPGGKTPHGHHGKHPGGRTPRGHGKPGGRTPGGRHHHDNHHHDHHHGGRHGYRPHWFPRWRPDWWPEKCWDIFDDIFNKTRNDTDVETTDIPVTVPDYVVDGESESPVGPTCSVECPIDTPENPLTPVCGSNGKTYESSCVLELVACITNDYELTVEYEDVCIDTPIARSKWLPRL